MKLLTVILVLSLVLPCYAHKPHSLEPDMPYGGYSLGGSDTDWAGIWCGTVVITSIVTMVILVNLNKGDDDVQEWPVFKFTEHLRKMNKCSRYLSYSSP